jgi:hypothetical protein
VRKILGFAAVVALTAPGLAACRSGGGGAAADRPLGVQAPPAGSAGATTSGAAVERFLGAARASDYRTMGFVFGTAQGAIASRDDANDVEKRMRALACYLTHDRAQQLEDVPGSGRERVVTVQLTQRTLTKRTRFTTVPGPAGRWYVRAFDVEPIADFCRSG